MNLVSLLIAAAIVDLSVGSGENDVLRIGIALVATAIIAGAVYVSKRRPIAIADDRRGADARRAPDAPVRLRPRPCGGPAALGWPRGPLRPTSSTGSATALRAPASGTTGWRRCSARRRTPPCRATRPSRACGPPPAARRWRPWSGCGRCRPRCRRDDADRALPGLVEPLVAAGLLERVRRRGPGPGRRPALRRRRAATGGWSATSRPGWTARRSRSSADHVLGICVRLDVPGPADRAASRSARRWTSAPAAACRRCTSPSTPTTSSPPTSTSGRWR